MRASLNVRLSKAAGAANVSRDGMIADLRTLCAREGFEEVALHVDDGQSGAIRDRPGFLRWVADAREGRADVLVAWHVDRMTREGLNVAAALLDVVEGKDETTGRVIYPPVRLMDTKGLDSDNGEGFRMLFVVRAEIARAERERMRDRNRATAERLRRAGRWAGGSPPFGYVAVPNPDGAGKVLAVDPAEANIVQEAAQMVLAGHSVGRVARWLNSQGHTARNGGVWRRSTLTQILTGNAIVGGVTIDGEPVRDPEGRLFRPYPEVVDLSTALALRATLAPKTTREYRGRLPARLLSGIITCGTCGSRLLVVNKGGDTGTVYRCQAQGNGLLCGRAVNISAERAEEHVTREFLDGFGRLPMTRERVTVSGVEDLAAVDDQIAATLAELGTAATAETFARLQALQAERADLASAPRETRTVRVPTGRSVREEWDARDVEGRREMLSDAVELLEAGPGKPTGRRGFDPSRIRIIWAEGEHDPD
ncbi:recombinase family protein [Micromonospora aurantiaca (nom. illeg.)]|uniref:recombinase family protein n=1 Tax=Micromonospora aurantiaca (nom. illeg.) TaxID=47850 RepID=UPI0037B48607